VIGNLDQSIQRFVRRQVLSAVAALVVLCSLSIFVNYLYRANQAEQTAKFISHMAKVRELREVSYILQEARLSYFTTIHYEDPVAKLSFTLPEVAELYPNRSMIERIQTAEITLHPESDVSTERTATIRFEYNRFSFFGYAAILWLLIVAVAYLQTRSVRKRMAAQFADDLTKERNQIKAQIAKDVRHNIRTPMAALMRLGDVASLNKEESDLFKSIVVQIRALISQLDERPSRDGETPDITIYDCLLDAVHELRLVLPEHVTFRTEIADSVSSAKVRFVSHEMRSIISNLFNNSTEALYADGNIDIVATDEGDAVVISIADTGRGISAENLLKVKTERFTHGKKNGEGIGLFHASEHLGSWGGDLEIQSQVGLGTKVTMRLPLIEREPWYVPRIKMKPSDVALIIDDQISVHRLWDMLLTESGFEGPRLFFFSGEEALASDDFLSMAPTRIHAFVDFDLGPDSQNGMEVLKRLPKLAERYLVTGSFDDVAIRTSCETTGLWLIPKTDLPSLPIVII